MRRVIADPPPPDDDLTKEKIRKQLEAWAAYYTDPQHNSKPEFDEKLYKRFRDYLLDKFNRHCAYCETPIVGFVKGDVEHYRPKHIYWWLAYQWGNLLPSCFDCNRIFKGKGFPVKGARATNPSEHDEALLLNPLFDDPKDEIMWKIADAAPKGITEKGTVTVEVLGLDRELLNDARKYAREAARNTVDDILKGLGNVGEFETPIQFRDKVYSGKSPYSAYLMAVMKRQIERRIREAKEALEGIQKIEYEE